MKASQLTIKTDIPQTHWKREKLTISIRTGVVCKLEKQIMKLLPEKRNLIFRVNNPEIQ